MLKLRPLLWICAFLPVLAIAGIRSGKPFFKTEDGVVIYPDEDYSGRTRAIRLQIVSDNIIRVIASPTKEFPAQQSLVTIYKSESLPKWDLVSEENKDHVTLKTKLLTVVANLTTGTVQFYDATGRVILGEKKMGRSFTETVFEGERTWSVNQAFETSPDDSWYGLGQHQDGLMNYKGYQVFLWQNNTEVAVPFLISGKNYGILWDNNSITRAGDTREYKGLSSLKLFSKDGQAGWLTASYYNDKTKPDALLMQRAESSIAYQYLNDSKLYLPPTFNPAKGMLVWEGSIASECKGVHKLRFTYGGYIKVWVNGKLMLDRWRVAWNPGSAILDVPFEENQKLPVKIEWMPDGTESYISLKWLQPPAEKDANTLGFASEAGKQMDYYFIYGNNMDEVIGGYRLLTGKATMLPIWTFGLWQSRERYKTQDEVINTVKEFRKRKIPLDNIVLDWSYWKENAWGSQEFEQSRFPNPDSMIRVLHQQYNTRFMISVWPKFYEGIETYKLFDKNGWLYKRNIADRQRDWIAHGYVSTFYDAFNEGARKGFWDLINDKLYKKGVDAFWMDASEPDILSNVSPQKRKEQMYPLSAGNTSEYVNAYPLVNAQGIYEGQRGTDPNKRVFILTRSAFPGMQRFAAATWSGDIASRWHDMKLQIAAGVNFSMSGLPYWSMDIGGFAVEKKYEKPNKEDLEEWREMNARWFQFGAFVPLFRVHGQFPYREMYNISPEDHSSYQSMLYYTRLRYRLLPYIYSLAGMTYQRDYTIMRGLVMDFPADNVARNIADQYMFGPSLLISPVSEYRQRSRSVYLPSGQGWYNFYTGAWFEGGQSVTADAPYERMPVFVKAGAIIPFGPALQYTTEKRSDTTTLYIYGGRDGVFTLYEDEGLNYNYEKGMYSSIPIFYSDEKRSLTIQKREGEFPGMLKKRYFRVKYISKNKPGGLELDKKEGPLITYNGDKQTLLLK